MATLTATIDLPVTAFTVRDARCVTLDLAAAWDSGVSREDLTLLVDDLTADVVAHAGGESSLVLEMSLSGDVLRVGLADGSAVRPLAAAATTLEPHRALARRWGDEPYRGGHRVWFELVPPTDPDDTALDPGPDDVDLDLDLDPGLDDPDEPRPEPEAVEDALRIALETVRPAQPPDDAARPDAEARWSR